MGCQNHTREQLTPHVAHKGSSCQDDFIETKKSRHWSSKKVMCAPPIQLASLHTSACVPIARHFSYPWLFDNSLIFLIWS
jgi:hypothetical protein